MTKVQKLDAKSVEAMQRENKAVLIDVRSPGEILGGEIPNSVVMPFDLVSAKRLHDTVGDGKKVVFVCRSGVRAAQAAEAVANSMDAVVLEGGIDEWKNSGLPVTEGRNVIPLDRQVQITVGSLILLTVLLTYFVSMAFLIFPGLMGAGLLFAGLSGSCGMARVLLMMPWNKHPLCTSGACGATPRTSS